MIIFISEDHFEIFIKITVSVYVECYNKYFIIQLSLWSNNEIQNIKLSKIITFNIIKKIVVTCFYLRGFYLQS